jgi:hypothetical protein
VDSQILSSFIKTNPHKMDKWLRKIPVKKRWIEDDANNVTTTRRRQVDGGTDTAPSTSSSSATLQGRNSDNLILKKK